MPNQDLGAALRNVVAEAVASALNPYSAALKKLDSLVGSGGALPIRRGPGRPPGSKNRTSKGNGRSAAPAQDRGDASKFKPKQKVTIRVGRGSDTGVVTKVEVDSGSVWVKRDNHKGPAVKRPARGVTRA